MRDGLERERIHWAGGYGVQRWAHEWGSAVVVDGERRDLYGSIRQAVDKYLEILPRRLTAYVPTSASSGWSHMSWRIVEKRTHCRVLDWHNREKKQKGRCQNPPVCSTLYMLSAVSTLISLAQDVHTNTDPAAFLRR